MKLVRYRASPNFGDDLNDVVWPRMLPSRVLEAPDLVLLGIGTVLDRSYVPCVPPRQRVVVLGSGTGYGPAPRDLERFEFLAVRGPLTAGLVGCPDAVATDGAALVALLPDLAARATDPRNVLFMPHHDSVADGNWELAAKRAGTVFVDPRWPVERSLAFFASARLVIAEAMHAAVVADALRIPWVPAVGSPDVLGFKWLDWTASLRVPLEWARLPPSSALHAARLLRARRRGAPTDPGRDLRAVVEQQRAVWNGPDSPARPRRNRPRARQRVADLLRAFDEPFVERAARSLERAASSGGFLSDDAVLAERLAKLKDAVDQL